MSRWGDHYWMVDMQMDCAETADGWFELKSLLTNAAWESDIQQLTCTGSGASAPPYATKNHMARCGYINKFSFNSGDCLILEF